MSVLFWVKSRRRDGPLNHLGCCWSADESPVQFAIANVPPDTAQPVRAMPTVYEFETVPIVETIEYCAGKEFLAPDYAPPSGNAIR